MHAGRRQRNRPLRLGMISFGSFDGFKMSMLKADVSCCHAQVSSLATLIINTVLLLIMRNA